MVRKLKVKNLTESSFSPYGRILDVGVIEPKMKEDIFTFWDGLAEMEVDGKLTVGFLEVVTRSPEFSMMERHVKTEEIFFAIDGSVIALVFLQEETRHTHQIGL